MAKISNALIVGAGIGGLAAAVALRQIGVAVDVVEVKEKMTVFGVGIIQPSNALRALDRLGLARACVEQGGGFPGWRLYDGHDKMFAEIPNANVAAEGMPPVNGITRMKLHVILETATRDAGADIRYGTTVKDFSDRGDIVSVTFADGRQKTYDLIIGADGYASQLRGKLFGDTLKPTFTGEGVWRHNFKRPPEAEWGSIHYGKKSKAGLVPMSADSLYMFLVTHEPDNHFFQPEELVPELKARLAEYTGLIARLADQITEPSQIVYKPMESLIVPPPWGKGRAILIGDAVHASTPHLAQGASLAVEDAVLLADMLGEPDGQSVVDTLSAFTARRYPRAQMVVDGSIQLGKWEIAEWSGHPDPDAQFGGLFGQLTVAMMQPV